MKSITKANLDTEMVQSIVSQANFSVIQKLPALDQAIQLAWGLSELRKLITNDVTSELFMPLRGTRLGFVTDLDRDKDGRRYGVDVVRDCVIDALMHGLRPVGNEFNIIAGNMYPAQAGLGRLVREFPGLTNLEMIPGVAQVREDRAAVPYLATWLLNGDRMTLECRYDEGSKMDTRIVVSVNRGMGPDAILGKAERKMYARILKRVGGVWVSEGDDAAGDSSAITVAAEAPEPVAPPEQDGRRMKLGKDKRQAEAHDEPPMREPGEDG